MFIREQAIGLFYSIALHVALVALVFLSVNPEPVKPPQGISIQAEIIDVSQLKKPPKQNPKKPIPKPPEKKEPVKKQQPKKAEPKKEPPKPKPVEKKKEPKPVVQKPQIDPKKRQESSERQKKLEELRKKRQELEQNTPQPITSETNKVEPAEQVPTGTQKGSISEDAQLLSQYIGSIQAAVTRQWSRPTSTPKGLTCRIKVSQIPGGGVIDVSIASPCNASALIKNSIINAVKKADPLPYRGFEKVFDRRIYFNFEYHGD